MLTTVLMFRSFALLVFARKGQDPLKAVMLARLSDIVTLCLELVNTVFED